jgi:hypothetical protein
MSLTVTTGFLGRGLARRISVMIPNELQRIITGMMVAGGKIPLNISARVRNIRIADAIILFSPQRSIAVLVQWYKGGNVLRSSLLMER